MGFPTDNWDYLLFYMLSKHLDDDYISKFEMEIAVNNQTIPTLRELTDFLAKQASGMDAVEFNKVNSKGKSVLKNTQGRVAKNAPTCSFLATNKDNVPNNNCLYCKGNHLIYTCSEFHNIPPKERYNFVKTNSFCVNCISNKHNFYNCRSKGVCRHRKRRHHSLLHFSSSPRITETSNTQANPSNITNNKNETTAGTSTSSNASQFCGLSESQVINDNSKSITVLLATANVDILNNVNKTLRVKALLDCGSQTSYITQSLFNKLGIDHFHNNVLIQGLSDMNIQSSCGSTFFKIKTIHAKTPITVEAVILKKLCPIMPSTNLPKKEDLSYLQNISLADETFNEPHHIDIILGADIYPEILLDGRIQGKSSEPYAINTIFGWVLMGKFETDNKNKSAISLLSFANSDNDLINETLKRFWEIEGLPAISNLSPAENLCETKFVNSVVRNDTGRYQVDLPFKDKKPCFDFNKARAMALRRFTQLENRLNKNDDLKGKYDETIKEYLTSNYLEEIPINEHFQESYYIPHHYVEHGNKFRIVYDASAKVFDGNSLNDHLLIGAKLQTDICFILLNFRFHKYVFTCDIKCMFPQLLINPAHRNFLRILYRFKKEENIKDYRMTRVTFGLACSPFLANRVIKQLAKDEESRFPIGSKILQNNLYVDDCCCGANSISASLIMRDELISILQSAGFELRKWSSNDARLLQNLNPDHILYNPLSFDTNSDILKILGLCWDPSNDSFRFRIKNNARACTKRNILSDIARIYDPMGYLTPSTVFIKQILQSLWVAALDWDEEPAEPIRVKWFKFKEELECLNEVKIYRPIKISENSILELHGFADASIKSYAAAVYIRVISDSSISSYLLMSKSKIAPIKPVSIPRLELCAALLLSELMDYIQNILKNTIIIAKTVAWSDSTVALCWIHSLPYKFTSFIANRVAKIQEMIVASSWKYVKSADNPVDCASRGLSPKELITHNYWWYGPDWLNTPDEDWPISKVSFEKIDASILEERKCTFSSFPVSENVILSLLQNYSSLNKIERILKRVLRFINNANFATTKPIIFSSQVTANDPLTILIKFVQNVHFADDISNLIQKKSPSRYLRKLNVFLDNENVLRVGGRLSKSNLIFEVKYPILLPRSDRFTTLLIEQYHRINLHPGLQQLHFLLLRKFWILSPRRAIKTVIPKCMNCWKLHPTTYQPKMADLPKIRVCDAKPFFSIAVDFCGYFFIKPLKGRLSKSVKAYVCVFICLVTKAIHLEPVSDLSSEAFLGAFRRFISRRGRCSTIISDCGTNFVGASKFLREHCENVAEVEQIKWNFNPPSAPHFEGLVEAGVKSFKTHLRRVVGDQILSMEEFQTLVVQIEAILNSRPLCSLSSDPNDLQALTAGHFLTLGPLVSLPDPDLQNIRLNRLNRWHPTNKDVLYLFN